MRKTLHVLRTVAILFAVMFCVDFVAQATGNEPGTECCAVPGLGVATQERARFVYSPSINLHMAHVYINTLLEGSTDFSLTKDETQNMIILDAQVNAEVLALVGLLGMYERTGVSPPVGANQLAQNRGANATPLLHAPDEPVLWRGPIPVRVHPRRAENAQEVTGEISRAIREHLSSERISLPIGSGYSVATNDGTRIALSFSRSIPQETVDSVAQFVRDLPGVKEVVVRFDPAPPPPGISRRDHREHLLTAEVITDEQAQALFEMGKYWYDAGNRHESKPFFERFVAQRPHDALLEHVLYYLGMIGWYCHTANGMHEAVHYFGQAVRMFPKGERFQESQDMLNHAKAWLRLREMVGQVLNHEKAVVNLAILIKNALPDVEVSASYTSRVLSVEIDTPLSQEQRKKIDEIVRDFSFYRVNVIGVNACADRVSIQIELPAQVGSRR